MRRRGAVALAVAVAGGWLVAGPGSAEAAPPCPDAEHPIYRLDGQPGVVVGTTKVQRLQLQVRVWAGCTVTGATATVAVPRRDDPTVVLTRTEFNAEYDDWVGHLDVRPETLRNPDAGQWAVTYRVTGDHDDTLTKSASVARASRITFNAGPEPVRDRRLSFSGTLQRASWDSKRYLAWKNQRVRISTDDDVYETTLIGIPLTATDGSYCIAERYRGPGTYSAVAVSTATTSGAGAIDHVSTPR